MRQLEGHQAGRMPSYLGKGQPVSLFRPLTGARTHNGGQSSLLSLPITMLNSFKNTLTQTPEVFDRCLGTLWSSQVNT